MEKPKASKNKAKDVEQPKVKRVDLSPQVKAELSRIQREMNSFIGGAVMAMEIKGQWAYDPQTMQIVVTEPKNDK